MLTRSVAGKPYSEEMLDQCINSQEDYEVVFATFSPLKSEKVYLHAFCFHCFLSHIVP